MNQNAVLLLISLFVVNSQATTQNIKKDCTNNNSSKKLSRIYRNNNVKTSNTKDELHAISIDTLTNTNRPTINRQNLYNYENNSFDDQTSEYPCDPYCTIFCFIMNCCCLGTYL